MVNGDAVVLYTEGITQGRINFATVMTEAIIGHYTGLVKGYRFCQAENSQEKAWD